MNGLHHEHRLWAAPRDGHPIFAGHSDTIFVRFIADRSVPLAFNADLNPNQFNFHRFLRVALSRIPEASLRSHPNRADLA